MGNCFLKICLPHLRIFKMISVSWDHFEACMLGYPPTPPPLGSPAADRPTPTPKVWVNQRGGRPPPPTAPKTVAHPSGSHIGWRRPPWSALPAPAPSHPGGWVASMDRHCWVGGAETSLLPTASWYEPRKGSP